MEDSQQSSSQSPPSVFDSLSFDTVSAAESLSVMLDQERMTYYRLDYLDDGNNGCDSDFVTASERLKIVDWCYTVVDHCQFNRETVSIAMELVDRFLSHRAHRIHDPVVIEILRDRKQYQLAAMSALYIAIKINERVAFGSDFMAAMSRGTYTKEEVEEMEVKILRGVQWRVCAPTSVQVAHHILSLLLPRANLSESTWGFILDEVRFQAENAVRDYRLSMQRQSTVAMASILNAFEQVNDELDREALFGGLLTVIREFDFSAASTLFGARNRLLCLIEGGDGSNTNSSNKVNGMDVESPMTTKETLSVELLQSKIANDSPQSVMFHETYLDSLR